MGTKIKTRPGSLLRFIRKARYYSRLYFGPKMPEASNIKIDIIMPVIAKDLDILPLSVEGIRRNCSNPIGDIYLIGPKQEEIMNFAIETGCVFIDELTIFGFGPKDLHLIAGNGENRSGWIFQQLLKMSGKIGNEEWFVTMDADHILLQPHTFVDNYGRHVLYQSYEYNLPYYRTLKKLLGEIPLSHLSYVAHKMVFNKKDLNRLRDEIEFRNATGKKWWNVILESIDTTVASPFSEFETYGNFLENRKKICIPWKAANIRHWTYIPSYEELYEKYGSHFLSATLSAYNREL